MTGRLLAAALICAVSCVVLGMWVTHHPLSRLDVAGAALRGENERLAIVLTRSGYGWALTLIAAFATAAALAYRMPIRLPLVILAAQLISQAAANLLKNWFARPRPDAWLYHHELGYSFPSGHATTAVVFYGGWLIVLWTTPLPPAVRVAGSALVAVWALGVGWSRMALAAHYPTDVIGGFLFGAAWLCVALAVAGLPGAGVPMRHG